MLMTAYSCSIGGVLTPIGTPPNLIMLGFLDTMCDIHVSFFQWMTWGFIAMVLYFLVTYFVLWKMFPADVKHIDGAQEFIQDRKRSLGKWTRAQKNTLIAFIVPVYNVLAVIILEYYRGGAASPSALAVSLLKNPLIQGFIVGLVFHFAGWELPAPIETPVLTLANISIPMALVILGGTLHFSQIQENLRLLVPVLTVKMLVLPALMLAITLVVPFGFSAPERFMLVVMFASPVASSSYVMAESMGADGPLAGQLVAFSSAISVVTLFLWVLGLGAAGLLG